MGVINRLIRRVKMLVSPDATAVEALDDYELTHVPREDRRPVISLVPVWLGFLIAPDIILAAASVALVSTFNAYIGALLIGLALVATVATIMGIIGQRTGLSTYMLYRRFFGNYGAKLPVLILMFTRIGWNAVETIVAAEAMLLAWEFIGMEPNILATILAVLFAFTAFFGYDGLDLISKFSMPALIITFGWAGYVVAADGGLTQIMQFVPDQSETMAFPAIVSLVFAIWVSGTSLSADIVRYAKSDRDVIVANYGSIVPSQLFVFVLAGMVALFTGMSNPAEGIAATVGSVGAIALFLAGWTTVDNQYYSAGLAASELTNKHKAPLLVGITAAVAILSFIDITSLIVEWMILIGVTVPPLVGVVLADYYILGIRHPEIEDTKDGIYNVTEAVNPAAIGAWVIGAAFSHFTPLRYMPAVLAVLVAAGAYIMFYKLNDVVDLPLYRAPDGSSRVDTVVADD